jgi:hypothetical protein
LDIGSQELFALGERRRRGEEWVRGEEQGKGNWSGISILLISAS